MLRRKVRLTTMGPLVISAILLVVFAVIFAISANAGAANIQQGLDAASLPILNTTSKLLFNPLYNLDVTGMTAVLDPYVDGTTIVYAAVHDAQGAQLMQINRKWAPPASLSQRLSAQALNQAAIVKSEVGNYLVLTKAIAVGSDSIGTVEIVFDEGPLRATLGRAQTTISVTLVAALIVTALLLFVLFQIAMRPLGRLAQVAQEIEGGNFATEIPLEGAQEISYLAATLASLVRSVRESITTLEQRVTERTQALATSTEVSRRLSTILDQKQLVAEVVEQVQSAFNYYHAHIYLLDESSGDLVMAGGTGEAGQVLLARGHKIPRGKGLVGRAADTNRAILVADTTSSADWLPNPLLPETRSEVAVPISTGQQVLGVLDVQQNVAGALTKADVDLMQSIANQVAVALQNIRLYERAEANALEAQSLVDYAPEAIVVINLETGLFTDPNANAEKLYGLPRAELLKVGPAQMSPPKQPDGRDSTEKAMEKIGEAVAGGAPVFEWVHRDAQGRDIPCEVRLVRIPGARPRVRASVTDISERKKSEEALAKRAAELDTVATISTAAANLLNSDELLQKVVDLTKERFDLYHAHIYLLNEAGDTLVLTAGAGQAGKKMVAEKRTIPLSREHSLVARAARSGQGVISNDVAKEPDFLPNPLLPDTRSEMAIPMILGTNVIGVFDVQANIVDRFTEEDVRIKTTLSAQVAVALQNSRSFSQAQRQAERETMLNTISQKIQGATTVEAVLQIAARELGHALGAPLTIAQLGMATGGGNGHNGNGNGHGNGNGG